MVFFFLAGATGFEPAISALTGPHVSRYTTPPDTKVYHKDFPSSRICRWKLPGSS